MTPLEIIKRRQKQFNQEFVKSNGEGVEPSFLDPTGIVGPVKQFHKETLIEVLEGLREVVNDKENKIEAEDECAESYREGYLDGVREVDATLLFLISSIKAL